MSDADELPEDPMLDHRDDPMRTQVDHIGPFERTYLIVNGHKVPGVTVEAMNGKTSFVVDDRLAFDVSHGDADTVACLVAAVTANAHGFPCWPSVAGEIPDRKTLFGPVWIGVTAVETNDGGEVGDHG